MKTFNTQLRTDKTILALGAESAGNFSFYDKVKIFFSEDLGDLYDKKTFHKFQKSVLDFIEKNGKPDVIISDLHPLFHTTKWGKELADKLDAEFVQVQHHLAHVFSAVGDNMITQSCHSGLDPESRMIHIDSRLRGNDKDGSGHDLPKDFLAIACDGTGYGLDGKIWGGEVFLIQNSKLKIKNEIPNVRIKRIGKLENQTLIGGELAIKEPARMLISILGKFLGKDEVYGFVKDSYSKNEYELLYNQWKEGFNCLETSSTGRVLDAVSVLLGFSGNERAYKHAPIESLEKNSDEPYEIEPLPLSSRARSAGSGQAPHSGVEGSLSKERKGFLHLSLREVGRNDKTIELQTTPLFEYLVENINKDKKRLASTAQMYLARGLWEMVIGWRTADSLCHSELAFDFTQALSRAERDLESRKEPGFRDSARNDRPVFFAGGVANNKIISEYLISKGVIVSKKIPRGDAGISFGQLFYYLTNTGN